MIRARMVLVSNRLPVQIERTGNGLSVLPSSGGLVTALAPIVRQSGGCWVGWTGTQYEHGLTALLDKWSATQNYSIHPIFMSSLERETFYNGCSNEIIWPLFHGFPSRCRFESKYWRGYRQGNETFADAVEQVWRKGDFVWVQDYHLMLVGNALRRRGFYDRIAYFHHIPFPTPDVFEALPWRAEILFGLMHYDLIGFQTSRDMENFEACLRRCLPGTRVSRVGKNALIKTSGLSAAIGHYPVSIDYDEFAGTPTAATTSATAVLTKGADGRKVVLGVDRLDYTKGISQRLASFRTLLETNPQLRGHVTMYQVVVPSREDLPEYKQLRLDIEMAVSEINGEYGTPAWTPIHYFYRSITRDDLLAFYRSADVALVTPLRDGMNLVAKEFCASRYNERGVLVLSEFAGAAEELSCGAILVNPNDIDGVAASLHDALMMEPCEQERRMRLMRSTIRQQDVFLWAQSFARDAAAGFGVAPSLSALA